MNKYLKSFLQRGLAFSGFGPIIMGIVYLVLSYTIKDFTLSGREVFLGVISTYLLAFVHAGASIFNQIEEWAITKSLLFHFGTVYLTYLTCYLINSWIPFDFTVLIIFTLVFIISYMVIWLTVYLITKRVSRNFNSRLK